MLDWRREAGGEREPIWTVDYFASLVMNQIVVLVELLDHESLEQRQFDFLPWFLHQQISFHLNEHRL